MEFKDLIERARQVKAKYASVNKKQWGTAEYMQGFVGDVGDLAKLVMAKNNFCSAQDIDKKLAHELADCLWSVLILADELAVDLETAFMNTMDELKNKIN